MAHIETTEGFTTERFEDKSLKELLRELSNDSSILVRQEAELLRREMDDRISRVQREVGLLGSGGVVTYVGVLALTTALILLLDLALAAWVAALIVGLVYVVVGGILLITGRNKLKHEEFAPKQSIRSVKQDLRTMREAVR